MSQQPDRLTIDLQGDAAGVIMRLRGELDAGTAAELERRLIALSRRAPVLVLDLRGLSFLDSLGLNMLFRAREWAQTHELSMRIVRAPVHVQRLITLAALEPSLGPFYADAEAALHA